MQKRISTYIKELVVSLYIWAYLNFFTLIVYRCLHLYWLHRHLMPSLYPSELVKNLSIQINVGFTGVGQYALITDTLPDFHCNGDSQCYPLFIFEISQELNEEVSLFDFPESSGFISYNAITDKGHKHFQEAYPKVQFTKGDIFYYVYGLLHSEDYRSRFADNLSKELPRISCVKTAEDFWAFSRAGRELAHWHLDYETVEPYKAKVDGRKGNLTDKQYYHVEKMKYGSKEDKTRCDL